MLCCGTSSLIAQPSPPPPPPAVRWPVPAPAPGAAAAPQPAVLSAQRCVAASTPHQLQLHVPGTVYNKVAGAAARGDCELLIRTRPSTYDPDQHSITLQAVPRPPSASPAALRQTGQQACTWRRRHCSATVQFSATFCKLQPEHGGCCVPVPFPVLSPSPLTPLGAALPPCHQSTVHLLRAQ